MSKKILKYAGGLLVVVIVVSGLYAEHLVNQYIEQTKNG